MAECWELRRARKRQEKDLKIGIFNKLLHRVGFHYWRTLGNYFSPSARECRICEKREFSNPKYGGSWRAKPYCLTGDTWEGPWRDHFGAVHKNPGPYYID